MKVTKFFESSQGDIYSISLSSENGGLIADDIRQQLEDYGISPVFAHVRIQRDFGKPE